MNATADSVWNTPLFDAPCRSRMLHPGDVIEFQGEEVVVIDFNPDEDEWAFVSRDFKRRFDLDMDTNYPEFDVKERGVRFPLSVHGLDGECVDYAK